MSLIFYPTSNKVNQGSLEERLDCLKAGASEFKEITINTTPELLQKTHHVRTPREQKVAYNWDAISKVLREIRALTENVEAEKEKKATLLLTLADIYAILRDARMSKLEAVRVALKSEAMQLHKMQVA